MVHSIQISTTQIVCTGLCLDLWVTVHCSSHNKSPPVQLIPSGTGHLSLHSSSLAWVTYNIFLERTSFLQCWQESPPEADGLSPFPNHFVNAPFPRGIPTVWLPYPLILRLLAPSSQPHSSQVTLPEWWLKSFVYPTAHSGMVNKWIPLVLPLAPIPVMSLFCPSLPNKLTFISISSCVQGQGNWYQHGLVLCFSCTTLHWCLGSCTACHWCPSSCKYLLNPKQHVNHIHGSQQ